MNVNNMKKFEWEQRTLLHIRSNLDGIVCLLAQYSRTPEDFCATTAPDEGTQPFLPKSRTKAFHPALDPRFCSARYVELRVLHRSLLARRHVLLRLCSSQSPLVPSEGIGSIRYRYHTERNPLVRVKVAAQASSHPLGTAQPCEMPHCRRTGGAQAPHLC